MAEVEACVEELAFLKLLFYPTHSNRRFLHASRSSFFFHVLTPSVTPGHSEAAYASAHFERLSSPGGHWNQTAATLSSGFEGQLQSHCFGDGD